MCCVSYRPTSTKLFQSTVPRTGASYAEDYGPKSPNRTKISDLSAANLRNNPHPKEVHFAIAIFSLHNNFPLQAFLSWRLPSHFPPLIEGCTLSEASSAEMVDNLKKKVKPLSTYQQDYVKGINYHQKKQLCMHTRIIGSQVLGNLPQLSCAMDKVKKTKSSSPTVSQRRRKGDSSSEMCESYQVPRLTPHLQGNTSRYGCSSNYVKAACGVVPTLHPIVNAPNYQTWYANEFGVGTTGGKGHRRPPTPIYRLSLPPILQKREFVACISARTARDKAGNRESSKGKSSSPRGPGGLSSGQDPCN